jgi:hypothetical protein
MDQVMSALLSAVVTLASFLGAWTAISAVAAPVLVCCIRSQARSNAHRAESGRREAWLVAATRR